MASMADGGARLVVGTVAFVEEIPVVTAASIFRLANVDKESKAFHSEREGWWQLLRAKVEASEKKRRTSELVDPTPTKRLWPAIAM